MGTYVHSHTTNMRPRVALGLELPVRTTSLENGLVDTTTTGNKTDGSTASGRKNLILEKLNSYLQNLLGTRRELHTGLSSFRVVRDDGGEVSRRASKGSTVTELLLHVANNGTLGHASEGQNVADGKVS